MQKKQCPNQHGFTLVEVLTSVAASTILLLTVFSLVNITHREWEKGNALQYLTHELDFAIKNISQEIHKSHIDSVTVSAWQDTLILDGGRRLYKDQQNNLIFKRGSVTFPYLERVVDRFVVDTPVITDTGDTLPTIAITLVVEKGQARDSTHVWMTPREQSR